MADELANRVVGILVAPGSSEADVEAVRRALQGVGAKPLLLVLEGEADGGRSLSDASLDELDGVVIPGGIAGADRLRASDEAVALVRQAFLAGKPVGSVGHGAWLLVEAGIAAGRSIAAAPGMRTGIVNAGGTLAEEGVRGEHLLVTARGSEELAAFVGRLVEALREHAERKAPESRDSFVDRLSEQSFPASDPPPGPAAL
jgi:protease I